MRPIIPLIAALSIPLVIPAAHLFTDGNRTHSVTDNFSTRGITVTVSDSAAMLNRVVASDSFDLVQATKKKKAAKK